MSTNMFIFELLFIMSCMLLNIANSHYASLQSNRESRTLDVFNILPGSRRTLGFLPGTGVSFKWLLSCPVTTITKIKTNFELAHVIVMRMSILYPEIEEAIPIANPFLLPGKRTGFAADHYIDDESAKQLQYLGYGDLIKKSVLKSDLQFSNLTASQLKEKKYQNALKQDRLRSRIERTFFYTDFEALFEKMGMPGKACMKRTICEVAYDPFEDSLFGELFNLVLTPSLGGTPEYAEENQEFQYYIEAETYGRHSGDCAAKYKECSDSVFSLIYDLIEDLFL